MRALPHPHLPAFFSEGGALRAKALQDYLLSLREVYVRYAPSPGAPLRPLGKGLAGEAPLPLRPPLPARGAGGAFRLRPLTYPERLLHRLREVLLPLGPPPGRSRPS